MARKDEFDFTEFDLDNFGADENFGDGDNVKDDRKPVTKASHGFLTGVKSTATSPTFLRQLMLKSLPRGYDQAAGVVDQVASESMGLYNEIAADTKPAIKELKRAVRNVSGALDPILPKKITDRIKKALAEDEVPTAEQQQADANEAAVAAGLAGIFEHQAEQGKQQQAADVLRDTVQSKRYETEFAQQDEIRKQITRLATYQDSITVKWQRKMLELGYRSFFVLRDQLQLSKGYSEESVSILRAIQKNTGLPEAQKIQTNEIASQMLKERLIGKAQGWAGEQTRDFIADLFKNVRTQVKEKTSQFRDDVSSAAMGLDNAQMVGELARESGVSGYELGGEIAGGVAANSLGSRLGKWIRGKSEKNERVAYGAQKAVQWSRDLPGMVRKWARSETDYNNPLAGLTEFAKSVVPFGGGPNPIGYNSLSNSAEPASFDNQSHLTLNEIIPGYLARLLQSSEGIRTGADNVPLTTFDKGTNTFLTQKALGQAIYKKAVGGWDLETIDRRTTSMIDQIDPNKKLDAATRRAFQLELLQRARTEDNFDPTQYLEPHRYSDSASVDQATAIAEAIKEAFGIGEEGTIKKDLATAQLENMASQSYHSLKTSFPKLDELASMYANTGNREVLRKMGLLTRRGDKEYVDEKFVFNKYKDYQQAGSNYEQAALSAFPEEQGQMPTRQFGQQTYAPQAYRTPEPAPVLAQDQERTSEDRLQFHVDRIVNALTAESARPVGETMQVTLDRILTIITQIQTEGLRGLAGAPGEGGAEGTGSIYDRIGRTGERVVGWGGRQLRGLMNMGGKLQSGLFSGAKFGFDKLRKFGSGLLGRAEDKIKDVYADGKLRLTAAGIVAGEYFDAVTKKPITKLKDIKGAVLDKDGKIVLTYEQYKEGLYGIDGKKLITSVSNWLGDKAGGVLGWAGNKFGSGMKLPFQILGTVKKFASKHLFKPVDVFVPGETKPRLTAIGLQLGEYYSSKTYKPIYSLKDIDSDVLDSHGATRLTLAELAEGVVDQNGKPITSLARKVTDLLRKGKDLAFGAAGWIMKTAGKGLKDLKSLVAGGWNALTGGGSGGGRGMFGGGKADINIQTESLNVLKRIYNLLKNQFGAEGDDLSLTDLPQAGKSLVGKAKEWWANRKGAEVGPTLPFREKLKRQAQGLKDKVTGSAKRLWGRTEETRDDVGSQIDDVVSKIRSKIDELKGGEKDNTLSDGKDTVASKFKHRIQQARTSIRDLVKEKNSDERSGSWIKRLADRNKNKDVDGKPTAPTDKPDKKEGWLGKMLAAVLGIKTFVSGAWDKLKGLVTGLGSIKDLLKTYLLGKGATDAIEAAGGVDIPDGPDGKDGKKPAKKQGRLGRMKSGAGRVLSKLGSAAKWTGGALMSAGGWAVRGGLALAGGIGTILTSPVTLTAAAVAVTAYGGYKLYKYFKDKLDDMQKVRMAQYGINIEDKEQYLKVGELELGMKEHVRRSGTGPVTLDDNIDYDKWMEAFGVDLGSTDARIAWAIWFSRRFKPVYLSHLSVLNRMAPEINLEDVGSKLNDSLKVGYVRGTLHGDGPDSPYNVAASPFAPQQQLTTGRGLIDKLVADIVDEYGDSDAKKPGSAVTNQTKDGKRVSTLTVGGKASTVAGTPTAGMGLSFTPVGKATGAPLLNAESNLKSGFAFGKGRILDDLAAVRLGAYGLVGLDVGRSNTLLALEQDMLAEITYMGEKAMYEQDVMKHYETYAAAFGGGDGEHRAVWMYWVKSRFVPVLLNFASAVRREDSTVKPAEAFKYLSRRSVFEVAKAIVGTKTTSGGEQMSVWSISVSPFAGMPANTDQSSVKASLQSIENSIGKDDYLTTPRAKLSTDIKLSKPIPYRDARVTERPGTSVGQTPFVHKADMSAMNNAGLSSPTAEGGMYKDVPKPTGDGSYDALKNTLLTAAQMVGVDPAILATIARIESSFRTKAKAKTSSASGLFQFLRSTWREMIDKHADKYGIPKNAEPTDPRAAALLGAEYIKQNKDYLEGKLGRSAGATDVYLSHFMGPGGSAKFLKTDPNELGPTAFPKEAKSNQAIFFNRDGSPRTIAEIYKVFDDKVSKGGGVETAPAAAPTTDPVMDSMVSTHNAAADKATPGAKTPAVSTAPTAQASTVPGAKRTPAKAPAPETAAVAQVVNTSQTEQAAKQQRVEETRSAAVAQRAKESYANSVTSMQGTLSSLLSVQEKSEVHLSNILNALMGMNSGAGKTAATPAAPRPAPAATPPPQQPVSVRRVSS